MASPTSQNGVSSLPLESPRSINTSPVPRESIPPVPREAPPPPPPRPRKGSLRPQPPVPSSSGPATPHHGGSQAELESLKSQLMELKRERDELLVEKTKHFASATSDEALKQASEQLEVVSAERDELETENKQLRKKAQLYADTLNDLEAARERLAYVETALARQQQANKELVAGDHERRSSMAKLTAKLKAETAPGGSASGKGSTADAAEVAVDTSTLLQFQEDSPFFRSKQQRVLRKVDTLGARLKKVTHLAHEFCKSCTTLSVKCRELADEISKDWSAVEKYSKDNITVTAAMQQTGEVLKNIHQVISHLALSFDALMVRGLNDYRQKYVKTTNQMARATKKLSDDFESDLSHYLGIKQGIKQHSYWRSSSEPNETELLDKLHHLRAKYELQRFDHVHNLNQMQTERLMDLVEIVCASFYCFVTFFHEGDYLCSNLKPEITALNSRVHSRRAAFAKINAASAKQRAKLERGLASALFQVRDAFPRPEDEEEKAKQVVNMRGKLLRVEKQGYLYKQSTSLKKDWKRRWFALQEGQLFYFRSSQDLEPQHVVNALLCSVRATDAHGLKFCFELISPQQRKYSLQAESKEEMDDWIQVFQNCTEALLVGQTSNSSHGRNMSKSTFAEYKSAKSSALSEVRKLNPFCVDCGAREPDWASINLGIMMCIECSGIHRSLGVHISKVRSITLDEWDPELLEVMKLVGNDKFNLLYEHTSHSEFPKPSPNSSREDKESYVRSKYVAKLFMDKPADLATSSPEKLAELLYMAAETQDVFELVRLQAFGANLDAASPTRKGRTALHAACAANLPVATEYLYQAGSTVQAKDDDGKTAKDLAEENEADKVLELLSRKKDV